MKCTYILKPIPVLGIGDADVCMCITELYEVSNIRHIATLSRGTEMDYLKALLDILLFKYLPKKAFSCEGLLNSDPSQNCLADNMGRHSAGGD